VLPTLVPSGGEIAYRADWSQIRYGQSWLDAEILVQGLGIQPGETCVSVGATGDDALALLARHPARVIAVDPNPAQIACLELRIAAYRLLPYEDLLVFLGSRRGTHRRELYAACRPVLSRSARAFWDERGEALALGLAGVGKFEHLLRGWRTRVLPLMHERLAVARLLAGGARPQRFDYFDREWDGLRWRLLGGSFLARIVRARAGREVPLLPSLDRDLASHLLARFRSVCTDYNPAQNPYLRWLLTGRHGEALPLALRPDQVEVIRANLDRLEWRLGTLEDLLGEFGDRSLDRINLADTGDYLAEPAFHTLLYRLARATRRGGRLAYWNILHQRSRPPAMADMLLPLTDLADNLRRADRVPFYRDFVVEEVI
jgi:S-adenosylmethionine-diacylglycerol 3-amino-3-carboxypropyl transferase